jgi:hypothetical protein
MYPKHKRVYKFYVFDGFLNITKFTDKLSKWSEIVDNTENNNKFYCKCCKTIEASCVLKEML